MTVFEEIGQLAEKVGSEIAQSDPLEISQTRIDEFAEITEDRQWIHTDPERAAKESQFGGTITHGFLLLSLLPAFMARAILIKGGFKTIVNCGLSNTRFLRPVRAGSSVCATFKLSSYSKVPFGVEVVWDVELAREDEEKPSVSTSWVLRYLR